MSTKRNTTDDAQDEDTNGWHPLPTLIGNAITKDPDSLLRCGGYAVDRDADGDIFIYRMVDDAPDRASLDELGDRVWEGDGFVRAYELDGSIQAPDGGWEEEISWVSARNFEGYR